MKFIKFPQATGALKLPDNLGDIPFVPVEGSRAALTCLRLTEQDWHTIKQNNYRLFLVVPLVPPAFDRPAVVTPITKDPFVKKVTNNGDQEKD